MLQDSVLKTVLIAPRQHSSLLLSYRSSNND